MKTEVFLGIGANIGDREGFIRRSLQLIQSKIGIINRISSVYESSSWGYDDALYLNCVLSLKTELSPFNVLQLTQAVEIELGRKSKTQTVHSKAQYKAREIDIDILFYGTGIIQSKKLTVPHPHIQHRKFVLVPVAEIASEKEHPILRKTMQTLLNECTDSCIVKKYSVIDLK